MTAKRVKVLFAIPRCSVGGAEKLLVRQLEALDRVRFEPFFITLFDEQKETLAGSARIDRCFRFRRTWDIVAFFRLVSYVRRGRFDVVVTHLFSANLLVRGAAILAGVPCIISYEHNIYPNKRQWQIFMDKLLSKKTARIIVDSNVARDFTAGQEKIPIEKFLTLHIPPLLKEKVSRPNSELRRELGIPGSDRIVLTVSRLVEEKGHTYLVKAAQQVLQQHPHTTFLVVGWGPLQQELREEAARLRIEDRVLFPGQLDIQDVLPLADVYVDPAVSTDLPIAIMEAMREGRAIVSTNVGDIPLFVGHGVTGLIAEPRDPHGLASHITALLADASRREQLGNAARERVKKYSMPEYMKEFEALILELYDQRKN
ncbi:glycosyltransferase [Candidatus Kaiserbacteria bacterium]|nr:glycosyltransferase [Candidatus Kaiserbacteria bacterium]